MGSLGNRGPHERQFRRAGHRCGRKIEGSEQYVTVENFAGKDVLRVCPEALTILANQAIRDIAESAVSDEAIAAAYEEQFASAEPDTEYNASHILVETEAEGQDLMKKLEEGARFEELAQKHSKCPSGQLGGALGERRTLEDPVEGPDRLGFTHCTAREREQHDQHEREAEIIAQAGRPGAVTIATNMAGRGTDIVLGGNLAAELKELGEDATEEQKAAVRADWQQRHDAVVAAGGLHIIGTERHESRRIDNQLRGRSGRQGDPGSSRFYLSLEPIDGFPNAAYMLVNVRESKDVEVLRGA